MSRQRTLVEVNEAAVVHVPGGSAAEPQLKAQRTFNRLVERIEAHRGLLAAWQEFMPKFQRRVVGELEPMQERCDRAQVALVKLFDVAHDGPGITRREQAKLAALIQDTCGDLLAGGSQPDADVVALHDKYSETSHADLKMEERELFKDMAETIFGAELDDAHAADTPEAITEALQRKMAQQHAAQPEPAQRRKSAKSLAREARLAEAAQAATQSVREIYRKLASALHPDRETDPGERTRKTTLMQQVNQAYEEKNLLRLLELQIQIEQIDPAALSSLSERQLGHYNQVLTEQCAQLEHEIDSIVAPFAAQIGAFGRDALTPHTVDRWLDGDIAAARREAQRIEHEVKRLSDRAALKAWLKHLRPQRRSELDTAFGDIVDAFKHTR